MHAAALNSLSEGILTFLGVISGPITLLHSGGDGSKGEQAKSVKTVKIADKCKKNDIELGKILVTIVKIDEVYASCNLHHVLIN